MENEMIERVAVSIYRAAEEAIGDSPLTSSYGKRLYPQDFEDAARAAIEAMGEPTEAMAVNGAVAMMAAPGDHQARREAAAAYRAMIETALAPARHPV